MPKLMRITTVPISLKLLLTGQSRYMRNHNLPTILVSSPGPEVASVSAYEGCEHLEIPFTRKITPWQDLKCLLLLISKLREIKPDIVHTHTPKAGLIGMLAAKLTRTPVRLHTIAGLPVMTQTGWKRRLLLATEKLTAWGAQKILPNSKSLYDYMTEHRMVPKEKLDMIAQGSTNGVDLNRFRRNRLDQNKLSKVRSQLGIPFDHRLLLFVGRLVNDKGVPELVRSFQSLADERNIKLLLVGPLENQRNAEVLSPNIVHAIEHHRDILHIPWSDEVEYLMAISDLLVHPSHREGFPNVLLQAAAMKLPIVCSEIPGNIDIVTSEQEGWLHQVGDEAKLLHALSNALQGIDTSAQKRAERLEQTVLDKYDREKIHHAIFSYYQLQLKVQGKE